MYQATALHFADLRRRYGDPLVVLNLLKSRERRPREVLLRRELAAAISLLNAQTKQRSQRVIYLPWDFQKHLKQAQGSAAMLLSEMSALTTTALDATSLFALNSL
ncbi:SAC domain-containing protein, partial [Haematococcus lacustris]